MIAGPVTQLQQKPDTLSLAQAPMSQADAERKRDMVEAWKAYRGDFQKPLKVRAGKADNNVISNRCAPIVDKGVSFLFGKILKITAPNDDAQTFLDGFWGHDDKRMTRFAKLALNGGVCGQAFVKSIPAQGRMKYPRIVVLDPQIVRIVTDPEDCDLILAFVIEYPRADFWQKRQIIARVDPDNMAGIAGDYDLDDTWTITNYVRRGESSPWIQNGAREVWPYPFAPVHTTQNLPNPNEPWGKPDLTQDIIDQNKSLNFAQSDTQQIIYYHAHPKTVATGVSASQIGVAADETLCLPSPDSRLTMLEMRSNLDSIRNFSADIRSDMDEQSRVPAVALGRLVDLPKGNISGVALSLLFQPLIEKTIQKQRLYGDLIRDVSRAALVLGGIIPLEDYEDYEIDLQWQNLLPVDDLAAAQTAMLLQQLGVSNATLLAQLGYDADAEADKSADEDAKQVTAFSRGQGLPPPAQQAMQVPQQDAAMQQKVGEGNE